MTRNNYGECWRTNFFDKAKDGLVECGDREAAAGSRSSEAGAGFRKEKSPCPLKYCSTSTKPAARRCQNELDPLVEKLKANAGKGYLKSVEVAGHTDFMGSAAYNNRLSQERADAVKNYFVAAGVPADKVSSVGRGSAEAKMTAECKAKFPKFQKKVPSRTWLSRNASRSDRRVELTIDAVKESLVEKSNLTQTPFEKPR